VATDAVKPVKVDAAKPAPAATVKPSATGAAAPAPAASPTTPIAPK
jgi:hypothetical protein